MFLRMFIIECDECGNDRTEWYKEVVVRKWRQDGGTFNTKTKTAICGSCIANGRENND